MSVLTFPDAREGVHELIRVLGFDSYYIIPVDYLDRLPIVNTWVQRSVEGFVDRVTWVVVDVYAAPGQALPIAEQIVSELGREPHEVPGVGYFDDVEVEQPPQDMPRPDLIMQAQTVLRVTARPV